MNRITCEVCGTAFQDTAPCCPICGWSPNGDKAQLGAEDVDLAGLDLEEDTGKGSAGRGSGRRIFDFDEANGSRTSHAHTEDDDTAYYGGSTSMEEERRPNTALVVVLVVFIALVLLATGVLVVKFLLPKKDTGKETTPTVATVEPVQTLPTEEETTEAPTIPCTSLYAPTVDTLTAAGEMWRLNVKASPEDTTDEITYQSENEAVVTVSVDGTLTAVGDGTTNVVIRCGSQEVKCPVTVAIVTEPPTEATKATEEAVEETKNSSGVTLKLKRSDITFSRLGVYFTLQLDCDLTPEEVTWRTSNSAIANVNNGVVTAMGPGVAKITAKYGDQEVTCIVRCKF